MGLIWDEETKPRVQAFAITTMRVLAWLDLFAGAVIAVVIWVKGRVSGDPLVIGLGLAVFLQGIFVCSFFSVLASIAENLIAIRRNTTQKQTDLQPQ